MYVVWLLPGAGLGMKKFLLQRGWPRTHGRHFPFRPQPCCPHQVRPEPCSPGRVAWMHSTPSPDLWNPLFGETALEHPNPPYQFQSTWWSRPSVRAARSDCDTARETMSVRVPAPASVLTHRHRPRTDLQPQRCTEVGAVGAVCPGGEEQPVNYGAHTCWSVVTGRRTLSLQ